MSLAQDLNANTVERKRVMRPDDWTTIDQSIANLKASGIQSAALKVGDAIPPFEMPNAFGRTVRSADLLAKGPLVVSFYRGTWCSYCNVEIRALQKSLADIRGLGAELVAVTPELPDETVSMTEKHELAFEVLSDVGNHVARSFGLVWTLPPAVREFYDRAGIDLEQANGDDSWQLPIPGTFVAAPDGTLVEAFADPDYRVRLDPVAVIEALRSVVAGS